MATQVAEKGPLGLENPMGTDGFEFVEYTAPDPSCCAALRADRLPRGRQAPLQERCPLPQGDINFILNWSPAATPRTLPRRTGRAPTRWRSA